MSPAFGSDSSSKSVINALQILEEVATMGPGVTAVELSRHLGLSKSATYRLVNLLAQEEYLVRTPDLGGFALGLFAVSGLPLFSASRGGFGLSLLRCCLGGTFRGRGRGCGRRRGRPRGRGSMS